MGSGTTLVESNVNGIPSIGLDISKFNVMLCNVKTKRYDFTSLKRETKSIFKETLLNISNTNLDNFVSTKQKRKLGITDSEYLNTWYHPEALHPLLVWWTQNLNLKTDYDLSHDNTTDR